MKVKLRAGEALSIEVITAHGPVTVHLTNIGGEHLAVYSPDAVSCSNDRNRFRQYLLLLDPR